MTRVLLTAFGPYADWRENVSWLTLAEVTRRFAGGIDLTTRLYPVDFQAAESQLAADMRLGFDVVLALGQAPGRSVVQLEQFALNVGRHAGGDSTEAAPLAEGGPAAYRSTLPLADWARMLRAGGIPAVVSFHAGDYLCNAVMYWAHYHADQLGRGLGATLIHLPLAPHQVVESGRDLASLPLESNVQAVELLLAAVAPPVLA